MIWRSFLSAAKSPRLGEAAAALLLALPLAMLLARTLTAPLPEVVVHGDLALIELSTLKAARFEQVTGPYSRFKIHHPGPALFYWLAPFHQLGGRRYGALCLGILVLNGGACLLLALVPWRLAGTPGLLLAAPFLALLPLHAGPGLLWSIWNPDAGVFPLAASFACAFAVAAGRPGFLPAGVFFGSFAAQCHVLYLAPVAAIWLAALAFAGRRRWRAALPPRPARAFLLAAAAIFGAMWWPVGLEQWRGDPGNLAKILHLKNATEEKALGGEGIAAGVAAASEAFWAPLGYGGARRLEAGSAPAALRLSLLLLLAAGAAGALALRRRSPLAIPAIVCWLTLLGSSLWTLSTLSRPIEPYFTRFLAITGPLVFVVLGCALAPVLPRSAGRWRATAAAAALAATACLSLLACREIGRSPPLGAFLDRWWGAGNWGNALPPILAALEESGIESPYLGLLDSGYWQYAAAIADQVEKRGGHVLIYEDWEFMFGAEHARGAHDGLLLLDYIEHPKPFENGGAPAPFRVVEAAPLAATLLALPEPFHDGGRSCIGAGDEDADLFLRSGFYPAEAHPDQPATRWTRHDVSRLSVRLLPERTYQLSIEVSPYEAAQPQEVGVSFNGKLLAKLAIDPGWRRYTVAIPPHLVRPLNEAEFRYSKTVIPREVSASQDHRNLALSFRSICFEEAAVKPSRD